MATNSWYNDDGTWRDLKNIWYNDNGSWRKAKAMWYNDDGTWRKVYSGLEVTLPASVTIGQFASSPGSSRAEFNLEPDGSLIYNPQSPGFTLTEHPTAWALPRTAGIGSSYEALCTVTSGSAPTFGTTGTWLNLGTLRQWGVTVTTSGALQTSTRTGQFRIDIRAVGSSTVLASCNVNYLVNRESQA